MRRARIKAIANVPVRRKPQDVKNEESSESKCENKERVEIDETDKLPQKDVEKNQKEETVSEEPPKIFNNEVVSNSNVTNVVTKNDTNVVTDTRNERAGNVTNKGTESNECSNIVETNTISPTKLGQSRSCFTKPIPRLDNNSRNRKNSFQGNGTSASESEDDGKKVATVPSRVRNDSVCSLQSNKEITDNSSAQLKTRQKKRRMLTSESARKYAEAKREFLMKHENKPPDRSKLTMYDLIYYNPVTNPMKKSNQTTTVTNQSCSGPEPEDEHDNVEDEPLPVPQVKVGPDGQLIVDDQSLVIECTDIKKHKNILAKEAIVDDDSTGGGFYKKHIRKKDWSKWETLMFYKVLNVVGTDFLLMQKLFPKRSRREIKLKYKREERINRKFVEKALANHQDFDIDALKKDLADLEKLEKDGNLSMTGQENLNENIQKEINKKKRKKQSSERRFIALSIGESSVSDKQSEDIVSEKTRTNNARCRSRTKRKRNNEDSESISSNKSDTDSNEPDDDTEMYCVRPTRSGRLSKVKNNLKIRDVVPSTSSAVSSLDTTDKDMISNDARTDVTISKDSISSINNVEPGSLVILSKEAPEEPGKTVLQVYMVSSGTTEASSNPKERDMTPTDLPPDLSTTVSNPD